MGLDASLNTDAAQAYEQYLVPTLNAALASEMIGLARLRPGERVLDVACGTGVVVRLAASHLVPGGSIVGLDIDPAMIMVARSLVRNPDGVSIGWECASAQMMPFDGATFDVALCLQGLQYLSDCADGLAEIRRVMKTPGRLIAIVWTSLDDCKGQRALVRALEPRHVDVTSIRSAYSFGNPESILRLATQVGFRDVEIRVSTTVARFTSARAFVDAFAAGSLSSRAAIAKLPEQQRTAFLEEIDSELEEFETNDGIALPLGYLVLRASR